MSENRTIARPYAVAVFRHAQAEGKLDLWQEMLQFMAQVTADEQMATIISNPRVGGELQGQLMLEICGGRLNDAAENFAHLLIENGKLVLMPEIAELFQELKGEADGQIDAKLIAAYPVNAKFEQEIAAAMQKRLGREVKFTTDIDKSLIGGVVIRAGDMVIDASIRGKIEAMASELRR